jgi:hypothetical protein
LWADRSHSQRVPSKGKAHNGGSLNLSRVLSASFVRQPGACQFLIDLEMYLFRLE